MTLESVTERKMLRLVVRCFSSPASVVGFCQRVLRDFGLFTRWLLGQLLFHLGIRSDPPTVPVDSSPPSLMQGSDDLPATSTLPAMSHTANDPPGEKPRVSQAKETIPLSDNLIFDPNDAHLSFICFADTVLDRFTSSVSYRTGIDDAGEEKTLTLAGPEPGFCVRQEELRISRRDENMSLTCHVMFSETPEIWLEAKNLGETPVYLEQLKAISCQSEKGGRLILGAAPRRWTIYQNGWASWTPAFGRQLGDSLHVIPEDERYASAHLPHGRPAEGTISSEWFTLLWARGGGCRRGGAPGLLVGFVSGAAQLAELKISADNEGFHSLEAICHLDGVVLQPGKAIQSERLRLAAGENPLYLLESYAERVGQIMGARRSSNPLSGWCTWYYYFGENRQADVLDNLAEMAREKLPLDIVLVDDGYPRMLGDWLQLDESKFSDMSALVAAIHQDGRKAGIWVAPFGLDAESETYHAHPDWAIQDEAGAPVIAWQHFGRDIYALDVTHPDVAPWLDGVFRTMRHEWGFDLFKIDFIYAACANGRRHDPTVTRAGALRRGLEIIRKAIGDEAFLLGCGAPLLPCVGMVDGMRVGPDVAANWHPFWPDLSMPAAENALRNSITRYFTHRRLWINDPDCVLVRDRDDQSDLVLNEMRTLASVIALLGGMTISSDNLTSLRKGRFKYLQQLLPPTDLAASPLDLFENELPQCLLLPIHKSWGEWFVVAAINWQDRTLATEVDLQAMGLPAEKYHVFNYWLRRYLGTAEGQISIDRHLPHETIILLLKRVGDEPDILTTTYHVAQTLQEIVSYARETEEDGTLSLHLGLEKKGGQFGEIYFTYPAGFKLHSACIDGRIRKTSSDGIGVGHLGLSLDGHSRIQLRFVPAE